MFTNSSNSIAGSAAAAARDLATSVPAAKKELADGATRAREELSAGLGAARDHLDEGRTRLADALDAAVAATRTGLRNYRRQAELQRDAAVDRAQELRETLAARSRDGLAYSAGLGALAAGSLQGIGTRVLKASARHPYVTVGIVAGACYLIARRFMRGTSKAAAGAKRRPPRSRSAARAGRAKEKRATNGTASA
ncbi:MAG TPA: hypothetical protein VFE67_10145 [Rudaea sp.]|nr:hypothetical protein [Rudaea sp.]